MNEQINLLDAIGNTPIVKLNRIVPDNAAEVWIKLEGLNPTGSYRPCCGFGFAQRTFTR